MYEKLPAYWRGLLGGKDLDEVNLERVRMWKEGFSQTLSPANLRGAFFDSATVLERLDLGGTGGCCPHLVDVHWDGANLAMVDWSPATDKLGEERSARELEAQKTAISRPATVEAFLTAVRANRQLAIALREQGMNDEADAFAYRARKLQGRVYKLQQTYGLKRQLGRWFLSSFIDALAGYGYKSLRTLYWYIGIISACAALYFLLGCSMPLTEAILGSVTAFHGRGLFETPLTTGQSIVAAIEAVCGLIIEVALIATFTWRFFGR